MGKLNKRKEKIINILYLERSSEIYEENYDDEYKIIERDKCRIENVLIDFLNENLSLEKFEIANNYIGLLEEKNNSINSILNKRFYSAGFCDGVKMY